MSGFQTYNTAGALVVSSEHTGTYFRDFRDYGGVTDAGYFNINNALGNGTDMGYVASPFEQDQNLLWFKFNNSAKMLFNGGTPYGTANSGRMVRTGLDVGISSGYLDVFDASGKLVWSAASAAKIPRIIGFYDIPAGYNLDSNVYTQNIGSNYLLASAACSNVGGDGGTSGYSGLMFRYSGGNLSCIWASQNQRTWSQTMINYGLRIPIAAISYY
jgi:hypothetical protein